ncbi:MAG: protein-L-isoaspartate(D-aspartate) O-methyltransferase, partial [Lautropia sp.]
MTDFSEARERMVTRQIVGRGIRSSAVIRAMREVPREAFVDASLQDSAYADSPLPIGAGQTISQPYIVAYMIEALRLGDEARVLEVGTGCGYAAAVLSRVAGTVHTIERHGQLARAARATLQRLGYHNVTVIEGDGSNGWPPAAPFDGIVVAAGSTEVPRSLSDQLAVGACLVMPVGPSASDQRLVR